MPTPTEIQASRLKAQVQAIKALSGSIARLRSANDHLRAVGVLDTGAEGWESTLTAEGLAAARIAGLTTAEYLALVAAVQTLDATAGVAAVVRLSAAVID